MSIEPPVVHVVDDDDTFRASLEGLLVACGYTVQTHASAHAYLQADTQGPGCLVLDVHMPEMSGLQLQDHLAQDGPHHPIIFLSGQGNIPMTVQALRAGADDFLTKPAPRKVLLAALDRALDRDAAQRGAAASELALRSQFARLTPRENTVFDLLMTGLLNKQIAFELQTSERAVKAHRSHIMEKLGTRSLAELTRLYDRHRALSANPALPTKGVLPP